MLGKTKSLASNLLRHAGDLEHNATRLDDGHPLGYALPEPCGLREAFKDVLIREDGDVDLTAAA